MLIYRGRYGCGLMGFKVLGVYGTTFVGGGCCYSCKLTPARGGGVSPPPRAILISMVYMSYLNGILARIMGGGRVPQKKEQKKGVCVCVCCSGGGHTHTHTVLGGLCLCYMYSTDTEREGEGERERVREGERERIRVRRTEDTDLRTHRERDECNGLKGNGLRERERERESERESRRQTDKQTNKQQRVPISNMCKRHRQNRDGVG